MADDESLITPDMEASIGTEGDPVTISINPELVRRLVESLEEEDADVLAAVESDDPNAEIPAYALITAATRQRQLTVPDVPSSLMPASPCGRRRASGANASATRARIRP